MAQMVLKDEGTNSEETSEDDELSDWQRDSMNYAKQLAASCDPTDKRFVDLYVCRKMAEGGVQLGFQNNEYINREQKLSIEPIEMVRRISEKKPFHIPRPKQRAKSPATSLPFLAEQL